MILVNLSIYPAAGKPIGDGFIQIEDGRIKAVGSRADLPRTGEETVDCKGKRAYPGFVDPHCHLGMWEDSLGFEGDDGNEMTDPSTPHLRGIDAINVLDRGFSEALEAGVTTVMTGPGLSLIHI